MNASFSFRPSCRDKIGAMNGLLSEPMHSSKKKCWRSVRGIIWQGLLGDTEARRRA